MPQQVCHSETLQAQHTLHSDGPVLRDNTEVRGHRPTTKNKICQLNVALFPELSGMLQLHFFSINSSCKNRSFPAQNWGQRVREKDGKRKNASTGPGLMGPKMLQCLQLHKHVKNKSLSFPSVAALPRNTANYRRQPSILEVYVT